MKMKQKLPQVSPAIWIVVFGLSVFVLWFAQYRSNQAREQLLGGKLATVHQLDRLDWQLGAEINSIRHSKTLHFDRLLQLQRAYVDQVALLDSDRSLVQSTQEKMCRIEDFKSTYAVMRNSVAIFLTLIEEIRRSDKHKSTRTMDWVSETEAGGLAFLYQSSSDSEQRFRQGLAELNRSVQENPFSEIQSNVDLIEQHAQIMIREARAMDRHVNAISRSSFETKRAVSVYDDALKTRADWYRQRASLSGWLLSLCIAGFVCYLVFQWRWWYHRATSIQSARGHSEKDFRVDTHQTKWGSFVTSRRVATRASGYNNHLPL